MKIKGKSTIVLTNEEFIKFSEAYNYLRANLDDYQMDSLLNDFDCFLDDCNTFCVDFEIDK